MLYRGRFWQMTNGHIIITAGGNSFEYATVWDASLSLSSLTNKKRSLSSSSWHPYSIITACRNFFLCTFVCESSSWTTIIAISSTLSSYSKIGWTCRLAIIIIIILTTSTKYVGWTRRPPVWYVGFSWEKWCLSVFLPAATCLKTLFGRVGKILGNHMEPGSTKCQPWKPWRCEINLEDRVPTYHLD